MSNLNLGNWGASDYRMLVDTDGVFSSGATLVTPSSIDVANNKLYFQHDFNSSSGFFFSVGVSEVVVDVSGTTTICEGESTYLTFNFRGSSGPINVTYNNGLANITVPNLMDGDSVAISPIISTTYTIVQTSNSTCFNPNSNSIITVNPTVNIELGPDSINCQTASITLDATSAATTYEWQDLSSNPIFVAATSGLYWVDVTLNGCTTRDSIQLIIMPPIGDILGSDTNFCQGDSLVLDATVSSAIYTWQDGSTNSKYTVKGTGKYWVDISSNVCFYSDSIDVITNALPVVSANTSASIICEGESVVLTGSGASTYSWDNGIIDDVSFIPSATITYTLVGVDVNNCANTDQVTITVNQIPTFSLDADTVICTESILLTLDNTFDSYLWQDGSVNSYLEVTSGGSYSVIVTNVEGCSEYDEIIIIEDCLYSLWIPNAFTPNDDELNNVFIAKGESIERFNMEIYNRWGGLVFKSNSIENGWDGRSLSGEYVMAGLYVYRIVFSYLAEGIVVYDTQKGNVLVIR